MVGAALHARPSHVNARTKTRELGIHGLRARSSATPGIACLDAFPRNGPGGTRARLIRLSTSDGHVRCTAPDGRGTPGASGVTCPERLYDQRRCTGCYHQTSCRGSRGSASLPSNAGPYRHLKYSAENMSSEYRSEKSLASFAFLACRPTYSALPSQHPHLLSAIDLPDGVHTPRERAIQLQSASNTSSSSLVIGSHKGREGHEGFKNSTEFEMVRFRQP